MSFDSLPRLDLVGPRTPLQCCDELGRAIGLERGRLWVKRDDLTLLAGGGNKARKLEYLCADALAVDATVLVTGGAAQSNHVRMTAAAASMIGLRAVGVLGGDVDHPVEGNVTLDHLFGLEFVWARNEYASLQLNEAIEAECVRQSDKGERPYPIPLGGSTAVGVLGYMRAAEELLEQIDARATLYVADGTGGTHAGLAAGVGDHGLVRGVDVGAVPDISDVVTRLATQASLLAGRPVPHGEPAIITDQVGEGYGRPTEATREALGLAARHAGLVLDPVYTGKAFAGLVADARAGRLDSGEPVVFIHTGGMPGLLVQRFGAWMSG
jgi:D-cysteine desulfhydrase family pyridoxal phosphate-dependent enzyme